MAVFDISTTLLFWTMPILCGATPNKGISQNYNGLKFTQLNLLQKTLITYISEVLILSHGLNWYIIAAKLPRDKISLSNDSPMYWHYLTLYWLSHHLIHHDSFAMMLCWVQTFGGLSKSFHSGLNRFSVVCKTVTPSPVWVRITGQNTAKLSTRMVGSRDPYKYSLAIRA